MMEKEDVRYTHTHRGLLFSHKKGNPAVCDGMDRQMLYNLTYMWNLKILDSTETETMVVVRG